jgi:hypothetical protein
MERIANNHDNENNRHSGAEPKTVQYRYCVIYQRSQSFFFIFNFMLLVKCTLPVLYPCICEKVRCLCYTSGSVRRYAACAIPLYLWDGTLPVLYPCICEKVRYLCYTPAPVRWYAACACLYPCTWEMVRCLCYTPVAVRWYAACACLPWDMVRCLCYTPVPVRWYAACAIPLYLWDGTLPVLYPFTCEMVHCLCYTPVPVRWYAAWLPAVSVWAVPAPLERQWVQRPGLGRTRRGVGQCQWRSSEIYVKDIRGFVCM